MFYQQFRPGQSSQLYFTTDGSVAQAVIRGQFAGVKMAAFQASMNQLFFLGENGTGFSMWKLNEASRAIELEMANVINIPYYYIRNEHPIRTFSILPFAVIHLG